MSREFSVIIEKDAQGYHVGSVPALRGCHTQAKSLDELMARIREAIELCLEVEGDSLATSRFHWCAKNHGYVMTRLPRPTGKAVIAALQTIGFETIRVKGSHHFLRHPDGRSTVVPVHAGETIGPGLMTKVLRDCELSREQFIGLL